ncbi:MAG: hypothetical protein IJ638_03225 [Alphaproteobacteria bacterium]|nr:hypothetical protein [Alphaproteobacteria bacterium]
MDKFEKATKKVINKAEEDNEIEKVYNSSFSSGLEKIENRIKYDIEKKIKEINEIYKSNIELELPEIKLFNDKYINTDINYAYVKKLVNYTVNDSVKRLKEINLKNTYTKQDYKKLKEQFISFNEEVEFSISREYPVEKANALILKFEKNEEKYSEIEKIFKTLIIDFKIEDSKIPYMKSYDDIKNFSLNKIKRFMNGLEAYSFDIEPTSIDEDDLQAHLKHIFIPKLEKKFSKDKNITDKITISAIKNNKGR